MLFLYTWVTVVIFMVIIWSYFQDVSIFGLLIIIVSCIIVIWHIEICIQFLFYIWEFLLFFFSSPIKKFLYIGSCFLFLYLIIVLIFLSQCASLVYSGNAIQVCPTYSWFDFSTKLPLFWKTSFLSSDVSTDLYYVLFTMFTSKPSSLLSCLAFSEYCVFTEASYFIPIWERETSPEMSSCIQMILF